MGLALVSDSIFEIILGFYFAKVKLFCLKILVHD